MYMKHSFISIIVRTIYLQYIIYIQYVFESFSYMENVPDFFSSCYTYKINTLCEYHKKGTQMNGYIKIIKESPLNIIGNANEQPARGKAMITRFLLNFLATFFLNNL